MGLDEGAVRLPAGLLGNRMRSQLGKVLRKLSAASYAGCGEEQQHLRCGCISHNWRPRLPSQQFPELLVLAASTELLPMGSPWFTSMAKAPCSGVLWGEGLFCLSQHLGPRCPRILVPSCPSHLRLHPVFSLYTSRPPFCKGTSRYSSMTTF